MKALLRNRKLGPRQQIMLDTMRALGPWYYGCGWIVDSPAVSERICKALMRRGLVVQTREREKTISGAGPEYHLQ